VLSDRHAPIRERLARVVERGRREGRFDPELPEEGLLAVFLALYAAAEQRLEGLDEARVAFRARADDAQGIRPAARREDS
jgi:hypothetical protein